MILLETWQKDVITHCPPNYKEIILPPQKLSSVQQGRHSGGLILWYKSKFDKHISILKTGKYHIWLKIKKDIFVSQQDLFVCAMYIPPADSPYYTEDTFMSLETETSHFQAQGNVLLCGDLNSRTGTEDDSISADGNSYICRFLNKTNHSAYPHRRNCDPVVNRHGKELLQICRSLGLYVANGRIRGDTFGKHTFCSPLGNSTVDYVITDIDPMSIRAFTVKPLSPLSDHSQLTIFIKMSENNTLKSQPSKLFHFKKSYRWAENSNEEFIKATGTQHIQALLETFLDTPYTLSTEGVNQAVETIGLIFEKTAGKAKLKRLRTKPKVEKEDSWFDAECQSLRKEIRKLSNQKHRDPNDTSIRHLYCETLRLYKRTLRNKKAQYTQNQLALIEASIKTNTFWDNWNHLKKSKHQEMVIQDGDIWTNHFKTLFKNVQSDQNKNQNDIIHKLHDLENTIKDYQNPLDFPITEQDLLTHINKLKSKKAYGPDCILNEMLKCMSEKFRWAILKLFNLVLSVGYFPDIWNHGLVTPIYKNGDKFDPKNYRGISVNSNLGKLFCSIINSRLMDFLMKHNILSKSQIGFLPNHRTTDHIYTLHTLIEKYTHNRNKLFSCFVDFKTAFDTIWHNGLFYTLMKNGVGGKAYDIIKSMYSGAKCAIKIGSKRTDYIPQECGVRQGCPLSPTLFNLYINELATILEMSTTTGPTLNNIDAKFLLFADDLVLLSPTANGLQMQLGLLQNFCQTWALAVNNNKTKIMIFQKGSKYHGRQNTFTLGPQTIEHVTDYTYLGLRINYNGSFNKAVNELKDKARRALYAIKRQVPFEIPIQIWLKIFSSVIEPIALYGSEVWGPLTNQEFDKWEKHPIETLHVEFCKTILKVHRHTTNNACRAELGRYPLIINIQKRSIKFWKHLKLSDPHSLCHKALQNQELSKITTPHTNQVHCYPFPLTPPHSTGLQDQIQITQHTPLNQIFLYLKNNYYQYWQLKTKTQSKMQCYLSLNREYALANYLTQIKDPILRKILTKYRLSEHRLAIETGRHKKDWLPREERFCRQCTDNIVETELHFLTECNKFKNIREMFFQKFEQKHPNFTSLPTQNKLPFIMGEQELSCFLSAQYIFTCHQQRDNE